MSDHWIQLIPEDPRFVPAAAQQKQALRRLREIAPEADEIEIKLSKTIQFFDCGANFERILCPSCRTELDVEWWQSGMSKDHDGGFKLADYRMPCCRTKHALHQLIYEWPQGFARFALDMMNPNIGKLKPKVQKELEELLGTKLRVIYQHL